MIYVAEIFRLGEPRVLASHQRKVGCKMQRESQVTTQHWCLLTWCGAIMDKIEQ